MKDRNEIEISYNGNAAYPVYFSESFAFLPEAVQKQRPDGKKILVVTDEHVGPLYLQQVVELLKEVFEEVLTVTLPAGEVHKTTTTVETIYEALIEAGLDRHSLLAALGGGVIGDMTGFAAATYLRGIPFIQLPTSLLAQVDSSVGGKTGVDFRQYKNMIGSFHHPSMVFMNLSSLKTLPEDQFACGMGEVIKTALLADRALFDRLFLDAAALREKDPETLSRVIRSCVEIKARIVGQDPQEKGVRALLNLGHTIGHAVEKLSGFRMLHGQCVAVGLCASAAVSYNRGWLKAEELKQIQQLCRVYQLPVTVSGLEEREILAATRKDKKMYNGRIRFVLLRGIGHAVIDETLTDDELLDGIRAVLQ